MLFGVCMTALQLLAVGTLNGADAARKPDVRPALRRPPVVVTRPPKALASLPSTPSPMKSAARIKPSSPAQIRRSALSPPSGAEAQAGLLPLLAGVGDVGLGGVGLPSAPQAPAEPDRPARVRRAVQPRYPVTAQRDGIEGYVVVRLQVDARGAVVNALVVDSEPMGVFERSAREAARRLEFEPARVNGAASPSTIQKTFRFKLQ